MSKGAITFSEEVEYYTPKYIVDKFGPFDYDPATSTEQADKLGIPTYDTEDTNGLATDWSHHSHIWINPPFTLKKEFLKKAVGTWEKVKNDIYILLPISFLTTKAFHEICRGGYIYMPNGRIKFENKSGELRSPAFGSVIIKLQDGWGIEPMEI